MIRIPSTDPDPDPQQLNMVISHGWCRKREEKEKEPI
jgi:hypothetical protein